MLKTEQQEVHVLGPAIDLTDTFYLTIILG